VCLALVLGTTLAGFAGSARAAGLEAGPQSHGRSERSASPAAPQDRARCEDKPSACGYPDVTNTGPRRERSVTFVNVPEQSTSGRGWRWNDDYQSVFVTGKGAVLSHLDISGSVVIDAPHVTLRDSRVTACGGEEDSDAVAVRYQPSSEYRGSGARIVHNTIQGTPAGCDHRARSGVRDVYGRAPRMLVSGNDISGSGNGVTVEYQGVVRDNWVHDLGHIPGDHHSGLSNHGGAKGVTFRHNTVLLWGAEYPGGGGLSGALTVYADFAHAQNVTLERNFVSGGSYVIYGGNSGDDYQSESTGIRIRHNRFACGDWLYGAIGLFDARSPGNQWRHNFCDGSGKRLSWH
jgi:hypothetical protein